MSICICKNLSSYLKSYTTCSPVSKLLHFQYHYISSSTSNSIITDSSPQDSFTVSYLITSCGLSSENALLASKYLKLKTPEKADSVIALFKKHGFSDTQISNVVKHFPSVLLSEFEKTITPKLEYFTSKGLSRNDLAKFVAASPCMLKMSLENKIIPTWNSLRSLLISNERTLVATKRLLTSRWASDLEAVMPNIKILREFGVQESNIVSLLTAHPSALMIASDRFRITVERVEQMGFSPQRLKFVYAVCALSGMSKSTWERKVEICKKWGWSEEDVYVAFEKHPWCMMVSEDKMSSIMDMIIKSGFKPSDIVQRPKSVTCSLEKRIVPRCLVYQVLLEKGLIRKKWSLRVLLETPEKQFLKKITMCCNEDAPELLKLYKEKLELSV